MFHYLIESLNLAAALYLAMAVYALTRPPNVVNRLLALIMLICFAWAVTYYQELHAPLLKTKMAWMFFRHVPLPFLTVLWLMLSLRLVGIGQRFTPTMWCLLFIIPILTIPIVLTSEHHSWYRYNFMIVPGVELQPVRFTRGPWSAFYETYILALQLIGIVLLLRAWRGQSRLARKQIALLLLSSLFPILAGLAFNAQMPHLQGFNPAPLVLFPAASALAFAVFRYQLLNVAPVARGMLFDHIHDGIVVTDTGNFVVDMNTAAERMLGVKTPSLIGRPTTAAPDPWSEVLGTQGDDVQTFCSDAPSACRWFERTRVPITLENKSGGQMFIFQDITDRMALQRQHISEIRTAEEQKRVRQWAMLLRDLHDGIGSISANIGLLAELGRKATRVDEKDALLNQIAELASEGNIELRTMMNALDTRDLSWQDLFADVRRFAASVLDPHDIRFTLHVTGAPCGAPGMDDGISLFRIVKESLSNTAKHAQATAVEVRFAFGDTHLEVTLSDDGRWKPGLMNGRGLRHIRQRVSDMGGTFQLQTEPSTRLTCRLPGRAHAGHPAPPSDQSLP